MRRLWSYLARYRMRYLAGCLCLIATASLAMAIPVLLKRAVDSIQSSPDVATGARSAGFYAAIVIGIALVQGVVRTFSRFVIFNVGRDVEYDLRNDLFRHLERLPWPFYQSRPTGDLMSRLVNDISAVRMLLGPGVLNVLNTPVYYLYAVSIMVSIDPLLTVAALAPYPVMLLVVKHYSRRLMEGTLRVQEGLAEMSTLIQENVSGIHVVKAYVREQSEVERFRAMNVRFRDVALELGKARGMIAPVIRSVSALGILVVLWLGGRHVARGILTIGDLVAFMGYLHLLAWPTMALGWMLSILQRGRAAMKRLEELFSVEPDIADPAGVPTPDWAVTTVSLPVGASAATINGQAAAPHDGVQAGAAHANGSANGHRAAPPAVARGDVELRHVSFAYPGSKKLVLEDIDVHVPAGATVAIVGRAGAGKTSLLHLLPRLFDPTSGTVRIDGRDVREYALADLRRAIAFVPQDPFLFSTSLRANVAFARPELEHAADGEALVREAAGWAAVAGDIATFPRGYDTMVGERGITLSGGQKQRVTLARALLADAPILILDDALSSVDTQTEEHILHALEERRRGRTCILVAHRLSTVQDADLILVLDEGRIVARGDHASLLAQGGLYADLFQRQRLTAELEAI
ncbi:ABC transporter ATP-binding protein/permease [Candidatus Binatia bacterium]|nr:ABC transporter ATP-binding protein/permease [Candidatus Binatia bacterium]